MCYFNFIQLLIIKKIFPKLKKKNRDFSNTDVNFQSFFRYRINGAKIFKDQLTIRNLHVDYINNVPVRNFQHLTGENIKIIGNLSILNTSQIHIKKLIHSKITDDDDLMAKVLKTNKLKGTLVNPVFLA